MNTGVKFESPVSEMISVKFSISLMRSMEMLGCALSSVRSWLFDREVYIWVSSLSVLVVF